METKGPLSQPQVEEALEGRTVFVALPGGKAMRLIYRQRALFLTEVDSGTTIKEVRLPGARGAKEATPGL